MKNGPRASLKTVIKQLLVHTHLSGNALAKAIKLPTPTIHRLITGEVQDPRLSTLIMIADYFGVSIEQLIGREPLPKKFKAKFLKIKQKQMYSLSSDRKVIEFDTKKSKIIGVIVES